MTTPASFARSYPFPLDGFQRTAIEALHAGESVLVAAPTGSGKTVVGEFGLDRALSRRHKAFYTTPLKALSNQKFGDFGERYGPSKVGLLTGDNSINPEAPIVVMTTEVLRNMLYEGSSTLDGLELVVLDEVHYLQDPYRGAVWEEVLIHLPLSVAVVCLSATVSNAEEFGEWIGAIRGPTRVVIEERRPVPLENLYMVGPRLYPMHVEDRGRMVPNPYLVSLEQREVRVRSYRRRTGGRVQAELSPRPREGHRRIYVPRRTEVVERLAADGMLPAIYFVFSRAGCDRGVSYLMEDGVRLTTPEEAERIRQVADLRVAWVDEGELATLGYFELREALAAGVAAHHAGMLPLFKETVERLFQEGLVRVVFATETLSLGINMPARSVVIEDLWKFSGERHELLTAGEYTQLTGRAGRRGIDPKGLAVVCYQKQVPFERVAGLASTRTYELRSSFRPSYNMAVNLIHSYSREEAHHLLNSSFAQFLADRGVVALERQLERDQAALAVCRREMACERGDFAEYWSLRIGVRRAREEAVRAGHRGAEEAVAAALARLGPGDVFHLPGERRRGLAAVVSTRQGRPMVVTQDRRAFRPSAADFEDPPRRVASIDLPRSGSSRSAGYRREVAAKLTALSIPAPGRHRRRAAPDARAAGRLRDLEARAAAHPCAACPDLRAHERIAERADRLQRQVTGLERRIRARTETLGRQFDRVLGVLEDLGYVEHFSLTERGERLRGIYGEADILVCEALSAGLFDGMSAAETAALASAMVYESRERVPRRPEPPTGLVRTRLRDLTRVWRRIRAVEDSHQVELCRDLDPGFAPVAFAWAEGKTLEDVLPLAGLAAGDFVRNCKQLLDLLRQMEQAAGGAGGALGEARRAVDRSVVAYTGVES